MIHQLVVLVGLPMYPRLAFAPAVLALAVLAPAAVTLARVLHGSRLLAFLAAAALAAAVAVTVARPGLAGQPDWSGLAACVVTDPWTTTRESVLNLLLFAPFSALAVLAVGRPLAVTLVAALASAGVEAVQAVYAIGACDSSDLVHNTAGALAAAVLAAAVRSAVRSRPRLRPIAA